MKDNTDNRAIETGATNENFGAPRSVSDWMTSIMTATTLFVTTTAILLGTATQWARLGVIGVMVVGSLLIQRVTSAADTDSEIRNVHACTQAVVLAFSNNVYAHFVGVTWLHLMLPIWAVGLLGVWLVPSMSARHRVLLWMTGFFFPVVVACIFLADPGTFSLYLAKDNTIVVAIKTLAVAISTLGFGLPFYSQRQFHDQFMWKMTALTGVNMVVWIGGVDVWDIVGLNAVVHSASMFAFMACHYRTFSVEWMYMTTMKNVTSIINVVMCLAIYCHLTSRMLPFALILCACGEVVFLLYKRYRHQAPTQRHDDKQSLRSQEATDDETMAINRFQRSFKPFIAFLIVQIIAQFSVAAFYPSKQIPCLCVAVCGMMIGIFRCYLVDFDNQRRARWLFGWLFVGCAIFAMTVFILLADQNIDHEYSVAAGTDMLINTVFLHLFGLPTDCIMIALLVKVPGLHAMARHCSPEEHAFFIATVVCENLLGELIGRLLVQHGGVTAAEEAAANTRFHLLFKPFVIFSTTLALLEVVLAALNPTLAGLCALCVIFHVAAVGSQLYLRAVADEGHARWFFGWGWAIVSMVIVTAFAFVLQPAHFQFGPGVIYGVAFMCFLSFVYLNMIGVPWLARWTMLCSFSVLLVCMPMSATITLLPVLRGVVIGESVGHLWIHSHRVNLSFLELSSLARWWSLAFDDKATERKYVIEQFERSYILMTVCCAVAAVVWCVVASYFPPDNALALFPLAFLLAMAGLRAHTELTVPSEGKPAYFGFGLVMITFVLNASCAAVVWNRFATRTISPLALIGVACGAVLLSVGGKLMHIPERHRQAINLIILVCSVAVSLCSTLGAASGTAVLSGAMLVGELVAFTIDHRIRSSYQVRAGLLRELDSKEAQMKFALDAIPMAACIADQQMKLVHANPAALSLFGYTEEQLVDQHIEILMMPSFAKTFDEFMSTNCGQPSFGSSLETTGREVQAKRQDGRTLDLRLTLKTSPDQMLFVASFLDLAAEKAHLKRQCDMDLALDTTLSPIAMTTSHFKLTYANQAMCNIFGYTQEELIGNHIGMVMDDASMAEHCAACEKYEKTGQHDAIAAVGLKGQGKHKSGHTIHFSLSRDVTNDAKLFVTSFEDISAERAQREIQRKQHEFLRNLHAGMPGTISYEVVNPGPEQRIEWVAGATTTILGRTHEEWQELYHPLQAVLTDASMLLATEAITAIRKREPVQLTEVEGTHRDGHVVWLKIDKASCRLPSGNNLMVLHDVTAEVNLRKANAAVALFQNAPGFIFVTMAMDMVSHVAVDGDVLGTTGYTSDEFIALDPLCDFLSPKADQLEVTSLFANMADSSKVFVETTLPYVHKDGHTIWLRACHGSRAIDSPTTGQANVVVVLSDVTATVLAQREVQVVRDTLVRRIKMVPAMVYEMVAEDASATPCLTFVNPESESIYGLTPDEMTSSCKWLDMVHPEDVALYEASITTSQKTMEKWELGFRVVVDGETKYLYGRAAPRREGSKVMWTGVLQDETVNHNLRKMTEKRDFQKCIAERFKAACAYLSHEIRNQLYPQSVVLDEIKAEDPKWTENIELILSANTTVTKILTKVLDLAKWESGEFNIDSNQFRIMNLFNAIASYAKAKGATIEGLALIEATWCVTADEHLLKQAATNLVSNASKFSNGKPMSIAVALERINDHDGVIVVSVTDKGRGMTAEQLTKVMVPFGQIRKSGEARSGTGLGLPLTKMMIEQGHKGTLTLASEGLGKGSTATMRVPVQWVNQRETPRPKSDPLWWVNPHPGATADILVVDDVRMNRMVTIRAARKLGLTYHEASDGVEAVETLRTNTYSMVFMDRQMAVMNGDVATEQARANGYTLPIVMTSGETFEASQKAALKRRGITALLNKMSVPGPRHAMEKLHQMKKESAST